MAHVEELEHLALAVLPGRRVALGHLPPAGDAGLAGEELVARVPELVGLLEGHGPGPDHGQVTREHVDELRQLVQARPAQEAAHARDARVVVELLLAPPGLQLLGRHVPLRVRVRVGDHAAQLPDVDPPAAEAHALLAEEGSAGAVEDDRQAQERHGHRQDRDDGQAEHDVEGPLGRAVARASGPGGRDRVVPGRRNELAPREPAHRALLVLDRHVAIQFFLRSGST